MKRHQQKTLIEKPLNTNDILQINPLIATLKPQNNGPSHSNAVIGTLDVDG